jgi:hypothetical protein
MQKQFKRIKNQFKDSLKKLRVFYEFIFFTWGLGCIILARLIFKKIRFQQGKNNFKVAILGVRTIPTTNLVYFDTVFGHAFKRIGCDVKIAYCDGLLDSCDADTIFRDQKSQCFLCRSLGSLFKKSINLESISFRDYITVADTRAIKDTVDRLGSNEIQNYEYLGVRVGLHAMFSTIRYFLSGKLDFADPQQAGMLKKKLVYAMTTAKVAEGIYQRENPDLIFMLHGIYSTWGPFFDYFRSKNIDVVTYARQPYRFGTFIFSRNGKEYELVFKNAWEALREAGLSKQEEAMVDGYLASRFRGSTHDHLMYEDNFSRERQELLHTAGEYRRRYILYSNIAWDAPGIENKGTHIFKDIFEWIDITINYFKGHPDYQLIIKPHPGELIWEKGTMGITKYIREKHAPLAENIVLLRTDTSLRAYDLITQDAVCLAFTGTLGLELATQGIPVLVVGNVHYKDAGVAYKINTVGQYVALLDDPQEIIAFAKNNVQLAKKYAYFYFFKLMIEIPFYSRNNWAEIDWRKIANTEELLNPKGNIIQTCKKIIGKQDIAI